MDLLKSHNLIQHNTPTTWISEWLWEHTCKSFANNSPAVNYLPSSHLSTQHHTKTLSKVCTCVVLFLFVDRQFCQYCHEMLFFLIQQLILHIISFGCLNHSHRATDRSTDGKTKYWKRHHNFHFVGGSGWRFAGFPLKSFPLRCIFSIYIRRQWWWWEVG